MLKKFYIAAGAVMIGWYALGAIAGWEYGSTRLSDSPPSVRTGRSSGGGWFYGGGGGYGGGK